MSIVSQQRSIVSGRVALGMLFAAFFFFLGVQPVSADASGAAAVPVSLSDEAAIVGGADAAGADAGEAKVKKKKKKKKKKEVE